LGALKAENGLDKELVKGVAGKNLPDFISSLKTADVKRRTEVIKIKNLGRRLST
jgi:hypothetical protein